MLVPSPLPLTPITTSVPGGATGVVKSLYSALARTPRAVRRIKVSVPRLRFLVNTRRAGEENRTASQPVPQNFNELRVRRRHRLPLRSISR